MATDRFPIDDPIVVIQGSTLTRSYAPMQANGSLLDTTGWDALMQVRDAPGGTLRWEGTVANGRVIVGIQDSGAYSITIDIPGTDTDTAPLLPAGLVSRYELKLQDTSGRWVSFSTSTFCVEGAIADA